MTSRVLRSWLAADRLTLLFLSYFSLLFLSITIIPLFSPAQIDILQHCVYIPSRPVQSTNTWLLGWLYSECSMSRNSCMPLQQYTNTYMQQGWQYQTCQIELTISIRGQKFRMFFTSSNHHLTCPFICHLLPRMSTTPVRSVSICRQCVIYREICMFFPKITSLIRNEKKLCQNSFCCPTARRSPENRIPSKIV